jgi:ketosteroid isomerase-like protein
LGRIVTFRARLGRSGYTAAMNRSEFEQWLQDFYKARLSNDVERCMQFFAAHSKFRLAGSANASPIARASDSLSAIRDQVTELVRVWTWKDMEIYNRVIDGDTAAVRYKLTTVFNPSGELITTEIVDVVKVSEHKVVEFYQFVDTAAIERLVTQARAVK